MSCLNCNKETAGTDVFCTQCQAAMEDYPIPRGTPVTIPVQPSPVTVKKQVAHHFASTEDQLIVAQRTTRRLAFSLILVSILLILAAGALVYLSIFGMPKFLLHAGATI